MVTLIHSTTSEEHIESIIKEGFRTPVESGRWGKAVYFMSSLDYGYGDKHLINVDISKEDIIVVKYYNIKRALKRAGIELDCGETGHPQIREDLKRFKDAKAIEIIYNDNTSEIAVYDKSIIKNIRRA